MSRFYGSFEEFAREELRPATRVGWSLDDLDIDADTARQDILFDQEDEDFDD